jgi:hypothetical protein
VLDGVLVTHASWHWIFLINVPIGIAALVYTELHVERPMLDLRLLANHMFRICKIVGLISMASFLGLTFVMPLYLQLLRGRDALTSGLTTFPQAFGIMISSLVAGRVYRSIGPRRLMAAGLFAAGPDRPRDQPVDHPGPDAPARSVHGLRVRTDAGRGLRDDAGGRHRASELDLLDAATDLTKRGEPLVGCATGARRWELAAIAR